MQVRSPLQMYHPTASPDQHQQIHSNGAGHTNGHAQYTVPSDSLSDDNMHPYSHQHAGGHPGAQQRSAYPPPPQLPSMHANMGAPHMPPNSALASQGHGGAQYGYTPSPYGGSLPPPHGVVAPQPPSAREMSMSGDNGKYKFELRVEQQPVRARMCGFGDKDRRPITPPPCIRLVITDLITGKPPANLEDIDGSFFVLQVDLWDSGAQREVNIVRASSASPAVSISTATTTSFPPTPDRPMMGDYGQQPVMFHGPDGQTMMAMGPGYPPVPRPSMGGGQFPYGVGYPPQAYQPGQGVSYPSSSSSSQNSTQFTRNLIGSLTVNASKLVDLDKQVGFWFVLQDLSVRTEGHFRLKMNFIDVGVQNSSNSLNRGRASVLASAFSDSFQVYSAKKFPGVIESTPLSKCFAGQGIKIPIRKEAKGDRDGDDDD